MSPTSILDGLSPHARVATAVLPFLAALIFRLFAGRNRWTGAALTLATVWFTMNVLLAPYSDSMRQDIENVRALLR